MSSPSRAVLRAGIPFDAAVLPVLVAVLTGAAEIPPFNGPGSGGLPGPTASGWVLVLPASGIAAAGGPAALLGHLERGAPPTTTPRASSSGNGARATMAACSR